MAYSRRSYKGAAVINALGGSGLAANATSITLAASMSGWSTSGTPFFVVVDPGTAKEEKICVIYASATTLTVVDPAVTSAWSASVNGRGVDDTTDRAHDVGATIYPVFTATEANQANELVSKYTTNGDIVVHGTTGPKTISTGGSGNNNKVLVADSTVADGGVKWASVNSDVLADDAVTSGKILNGTIVNADINSSAAIALTKLGAGALPTDITVASANLVDLTIDTADIKDSAVTSAKIADGTIVNADINASAAIALSKLATGALPTDITVASANLVDLTIDTADIKANAVTDAKVSLTAASGVIKVYATTTARDAAITSPAAGMVVYINSDDASEGLWHYNGTVWYKGAGWNTPWGIIARTTSNTNSSTVSTNTYIDIATLTFTAVAGRLYKVQFSGQVNATDTNFDSDLNVYITDGSNTALQLLSAPAGITSGYATRADGFILVSPAAGSTTYKVRMGRVSGTGTIQALAAATNITHFYIEDIGAA